MIPLGDLSGPLLTFGRRPWKRVAGTLAALAGMAATTLALSLPVVPPHLRTPIAAAGIAVAALGWAAAMLRATLEIDLDTRTWRRETGLFVCRSTGGSLDDFTTAHFTRRRASNLYGEEEERCTLLLEADEPVTVFQAWGDPAAPALAERIAARAGLRLQESAASERTPKGARVLQRVITWGAWTAMAGLIVTMAVPVVRGIVNGKLGARGEKLERSYEVFRDAQALFFDKKDYRAAERALREAVRIAPGYSDPQNLLAYALAEQNRLDEALKVAEAAWKLDQMDGNIADTVAEMHQRRGEWNDAANIYAKALYLQPGDGVAETHVKFAETLTELGDIPDAIRHLNHAEGRAVGPWEQRLKALRLRITPPTLNFP